MEKPAPIEMPNYPKVIDQQFFDERSRLNEQTGCIEWTRSLVNGYPQSKSNGKSRRAHRMIWEFRYGAIPAGMNVCHKCDNRKCINPDHLFLGTTQDNVDDKMAKGRFRPVVGEAQVAAKLSPAVVTTIRNASGPQRRIARDFGISQANVSVIRSGKAWAHV
jgi:hypothetical protein